MSDREPLIDVDRLLVLQASLIADREALRKDVDALRRRLELVLTDVERFGSANATLREEVARLVRERDEAVAVIESVRRLVSSVTRKVGP